MMQYNDEQLLSEARQILKHESEHLDMVTLMKLEKSRQQAIQQSVSSTIINNGGVLALRNYWPGSLVALSLLLVITFFTLQRETVQVESSLGIYSDLELLSDQQSIEFYEELEFYQWLEIDEQD